MSDSKLPPLVPRSPHGGPSSTAFTRLDFSVNCNPYGPNPLLLEAVREADHAHYPDPTYLDVRQSLADWHGVSAGEIALSVGASDLLHRLTRAFLPSGGTLLSLHAPFGELERAAGLQRACVHVVSEVPERLPGDVRLLYVGQPHNPTGQSLALQRLTALANVCATAGTLLVLDLAYAPFLSLPVLHHPAAVNLLSPGKAHGLVGARPAYAVAERHVVERLDNLAPSWHLPAGTAALLQMLPQAQDFLVRTLPRVQADAVTLTTALREFGPVEHHGTPYLTLEVGDAGRVARALLMRGIKVRDCASYGLPGHIRVSTQGAAADARLVEGLKELIHG